MFPEPTQTQDWRYKPRGSMYPSYAVEEEPKTPLVASNATWEDLFIREQVWRAVRECGFERPSEVQNNAIPYVLNGHDVLCQAKSGMGKTGVFVISVLNTLSGTADAYLPLQCLVIAHTREMAHQIAKEFLRIGKYLRKPALRFGCYYGGITVQENLTQLRDPASVPHIVIGTPGRLLDLSERQGALNLSQIRFLVVDECDKMLQTESMRDLVLKLIKKTPKHKQTVMVSATIGERTRQDCTRLMKNCVIVAVDEGALLLEGMRQYYVALTEKGKFNRLVHLLDNMPFNQVIVFVNRVEKAKQLSDLLGMKMFQPLCIHSGLPQMERIKLYDHYKANGSRLLISTDLFGRGIDVERVNLVINYDFPPDRDTYLHRVGRAGRFGTGGIAISFVSLEDNRDRDELTLKEVQDRFHVKVQPLPKEMDYLPK